MGDSFCQNKSRQCKLMNYYVLSISIFQQISTLIIKHSLKKTKLWRLISVISVLSKAACSLVQLSVWDKSPSKPACAGLGLSLAGRRSRVNFKLNQQGLWCAKPLTSITWPDHWTHAASIPQADRDSEHSSYYCESDPKAANSQSESGYPSPHISKTLSQHILLTSTILIVTTP